MDRLILAESPGVTGNWLARPHEGRSSAELLEARAAFPQGTYPLAIEPARFSYAHYTAFLKHENAGIEAFKLRQQTAFEAERRRWRDARIGEAPIIDPVISQDEGLPDGCVGAFSEVPGNIWKVLVDVGALVEVAIRWYWWNR